MLLAAGAVTVKRCVCCQVLHLETCLLLSTRALLSSPLAPVLSLLASLLRFSAAPPQVGVLPDFCDANPGATVSIKTQDWSGKYDKTWKPSYGWEPSKCDGCDLELEFSCPTKGPSSWGYGPSSWSNGPFKGPSYKKWML